jgi:hypothetical protein
MRTIRLVAFLALALVIPGGLGQVNAQTPVAGLTWESCPPAMTGSATPDTAPASGLACTTLQVPLDYTNPDGEQITIGLNRLPPRDPAQRVGSLIFSPGGPGGAGTLYVAREAAGTPVFTPAVRDRYDIIGMDPAAPGPARRSAATRTSGMCTSPASRGTWGRAASG